MPALEWLNAKQFLIGDVNFQCWSHDYSLKTDENRLVILKTREVLENYATVLSGVPVSKVLEFGIFQGGSPAMFALWFDAEVVGIDICDPVLGFDAFCTSNPIARRRIRSHYNVSQTDRPKVEGIIRSEFGNTQPDLIIDDASHLYRESRQTFEIAFPFLCPGGWYVIEDWGWPHWPGEPYFAGQSALSVLIMELLMLCASREDIVSEVRVFPAFTFIRKSPKAPDLTGMRLDGLYRARGLELYRKQTEKRRYLRPRTVRRRVV